ncbi:hypothetical protein RSAG8_13128, partial [Rhizoctonia solani AG-8 WAC10335]
MTAFNYTTTQHLEKLKNDDPEAHQKLLADALAIQEAACLDYTDMSPEALSRLLSDFPKRLLAEMEEHGHTLPVHIWCITAFAMPLNQEVETWTVTTQSVATIHGSSAHNTMWDEFKAWLTANLGLAANGQVDTTPPVVYPDSQWALQPWLLVISDITKVPAQKL